MNGRMFLDVFGLYFKASFRDENSTSAFILLKGSYGQLRSSSRDLKSRLFDSNLSLIESVRNKRSVSASIKPFFKLWEGGVARREMRVLERFCCFEVCLNIEYFVRNGIL